jgi:hypothetical protein
MLVFEHRLLPRRYFTGEAASSQSDEPVRVLRLNRAADRFQLRIENSNLVAEESNTKP